MARWNEADHPRDDHGRFGHGHGSDTPNRGNSSGGRQRGMPAAISSNTVKLSSGETLTIDRHDDGGVTLHTEHGQVTYDREDMGRLLHDLSLADNEEIGHLLGRITVRKQNGEGLGLIDREGGKYTLRLRDDDPDLEQLENTPPITLTSRDLDRIEATWDLSETAARLDTGNGDVDLAITDDNKFLIRHLGDDGTPVETKLDPKSFARLNRAINVVYEGFDESERFVKGDAAWDNVTRVEVNTNAGKVRVERFGEYRGTNPGDRLEIMAIDDSWGIAIDGDKQDAFDDAMSNIEDFAEGMNFYDRFMGD